MHLQTQMLSLRVRTYLKQMLLNGCAFFSVSKIEVWLVKLKMPEGCEASPKHFINLNGRVPNHFR